MKEFHSLSHEVSCTLILHPNIGKNHLKESKKFNLIFYFLKKLKKVNYLGGLHLSKPESIGVVIEFVSSNLRNFIEKDERSREINNQIRIAKQISSGMNFLHSLNPYILVK